MLILGLSVANTAMLRWLRKGEIRWTSIKLTKFNDLKAEADNPFLIGRVHWPLQDIKCVLLFLYEKVAFFPAHIIYKYSPALYHAMLHHGLFFSHENKPDYSLAFSQGDACNQTINAYKYI